MYRVSRTARCHATSWPPRTGSGGTFLDNSGSVELFDDHARVDLALRTYTPVLIDAGFPELDIPIPWRGGRSLRFGFPPR